jgi:hypothetical protein
VVTLTAIINTSDQYERQQTPANYRIYRPAEAPRVTIPALPSDRHGLSKNILLNAHSGVALAVVLCLGFYTAFRRVTERTYSSFWGVV